MSDYENNTHLQGIERASDELIERIRSKGRTVIIAKPDSDDFKYLEYTGAEANVGDEGLKHIIVRENPSKAALLEEFVLVCRLMSASYKVAITSHGGNIMLSIFSFATAI